MSESPPLGVGLILFAGPRIWLWGERRVGPERRLRWALPSDSAIDVRRTPSSSSSVFTAWVKAETGLADPTAWTPVGPRAWFSQWQTLVDKGLRIRFWLVQLQDVSDAARGRIVPSAARVHESNPNGVWTTQWFTQAECRRVVDARQLHTISIAFQQFDTWMDSRLTLNIVRSSGIRRPVVETTNENTTTVSTSSIARCYRRTLVPPPLASVPTVRIVAPSLLPCHAEIGAHNRWTSAVYAKASVSIDAGQRIWKESALVSTSGIPFLDKELARVAGNPLLLLIEGLLAQHIRLSELRQQYRFTQYAGFQLSSDETQRAEPWKRQMQQRYGIQESDLHTMWKCVAVYAKNGLSHLSQWDAGVGLFPYYSLVNHSCAPNAVAIVSGSSAQVFAIQTIAPSEEIRVSYHYGHEFFSYFLRQTVLRTTVFVQLRDELGRDCICSRCEEDHKQTMYSIPNVADLRRKLAQQRKRVSSSAKKGGSGGREHDRLPLASKMPSEKATLWMRQDNDFRRLFEDLANTASTSAGRSTTNGGESAFIGAALAERPAALMIALNAAKDARTDVTLAKFCIYQILCPMQARKGLLMLAKQMEITGKEKLETFVIAWTSILLRASTDLRSRSLDQQIIAYQAWHLTMLELQTSSTLYGSARAKSSLLLLQKRSDSIRPSWSLTRSYADTHRALVRIIYSDDGGEAKTQSETKASATDVCAIVLEYVDTGHVFWSDMLNAMRSTESDAMEPPNIAFVGDKPFARSTSFIRHVLETMQRSEPSSSSSAHTTSV